MALTERRMTLEAFLQLPEEKPALEFADGVVTQKVPPQGKHAWLQSWICELINRRTRPGRLARASSELRTTYARYSRVPDVAVYAWDRIPRDASGQVANDFRAPPDIAIEIGSPGQSRRDLVEKCRWSGANGVRAALLVDPDRMSATVVRPGAEPVTLRGPDLITLDDVIPHLRFSVDEVFEGLFD